ncbi:AbrB family transcriptional regulator [Candidatus Desantisbacteria bacterium]|nr:AbrB family transcriptional regulator [Candidatus Desantisbacteria bacterium]
MILPKTLREKANIKAGDKFAIVSWEKDNKVCCISLVKVDDFVEMVKDSLGPIMEDFFKK